MISQLKLIKQIYLTNLTQMSCNDFLTFHKSLLNKRYQEHQTNLNPFGNLFFTNNWKWSPIHSNTSQKIKPSGNKANIKSDIIKWFNELDKKQKVQCCSIDNWAFLQKLIQIIDKYDENYQYNLPTLKSIVNYFVKAHHPFANQLWNTLKVSWIAQPILWVDNTDNILNKLIQWMEIVSNGKIFEYAHKILNKTDPEQNILWFNSKSFHSLQNWIVSQFQKTIIKNFYAKSAIMTKIRNLQKYLGDNDYSKQLLLLRVPFKNCNINIIESAQRQSLKKIQQNFIEKMNEIIMNDFEKETPKKKKNKKKKNKKKQSDGDNQKQEKQLITEDQSKVNLEQEIQDKNQNCSIQKFTEITDHPIEESQIVQQKQQQKECLVIIINEQCQTNLRIRKASLSPLTNKAQTQIYEESEQPQNWQQLEVSTNNRRKKKRKKLNKSTSPITVYKEIAKKISSIMISKQLNNFIDELSIQTNALYDAKVVAFERVRCFIQNLYPGTQTILFGSNAVGLSLPTSDVDIMLFLPNYPQQQQLNQILSEIAIQINAMGWITSCSSYLNAKVPIVKLEIDPMCPFFQYKRKSDNIGIIPPMIENYYLELNPNAKSKTIKVDLTVNMHQNKSMGAQSTEMMKTWMSQYPTLHRILLAIKYILSYRGFNLNFEGGIGSYCLFVMIAAYIKQSIKEKTYTEDEGELFMNVLKFYGQDFQNQIKCIKINDDQCFKLFDINDHPRSFLHIYDPFTNRLMSGSCKQFNNIKAEFRRIRNALLQQQDSIEKEIMYNYTQTQAGKLMQTKKALEKWVHKYEGRSGFSIKKIIDGTF